MCGLVWGHLTEEGKEKSPRGKKGGDGLQVHDHLLKMCVSFPISFLPRRAAGLENSSIALAVVWLGAAAVVLFSVSCRPHKEGERAEEGT